jgi:predicted nuclease with TOPRIM domain
MADTETEKEQLQEERRQLRQKRHTLQTKLQELRQEQEQLQDTIQEKVAEQTQHVEEEAFRTAAQQVEHDKLFDDIFAVMKEAGEVTVETQDLDLTPDDLSNLFSVMKEAGEAAVEKRRQTLADTGDT